MKLTKPHRFSKQLLVEIPILRVLSGASIEELAAEGASRLSPAAIPLVADAQGPTAPSESGASSSEEPQSGALTPLTPMVQSDKAEKILDGVLRRAPTSLMQEYSHKRQLALSDVTISHNTIGVVMEGTLDTAKLDAAVTAAIQRHDIFRTAFKTVDGESSPLLNVLATPSWGLRTEAVASRAEAEAALAALQNEPYDLTAGETFKIALFTWSPTSHLLVFAYHRLAGDGSTTENLVAELAQLYSGATLPPAPQYTDFAIKQRKSFVSGGMNADVAYWKALYTPVPSPLALLPLPGVKQDRSPVAWDQYTAITRLSPVMAYRIKERTKKLRTTPMNFYLAAYTTLLSELSGQDAVSIGLADTNRSSVADLSTMGYFANLLPLRLSPSAAFSGTVEATKESVRQAMAHSVVPHDLLTAELGLAVPPAEMTCAPLFQAVFDYRQGAAESGVIGGASITEVIASRERTPYDVVLEMSDDPTKEPLITVKLQKSIYQEGDAEVLMERYVEALKAFSQ